MSPSNGASASPPRSCRNRPPPLAETVAMPFPHLASLAYFQYSNRPDKTPILRPAPPTPRKMLSKSPTRTPTANQRRRHSGIPRPASGLSRRATSSMQKTLVPCEAPISKVPASSHTVRPPRSDSLQSLSNDGPHHRDLSGVRQQLQVRNFSTQSVQGLEAFSSPQSTAVRSLMRPLGPPLPRSHTMGNITLEQQPSSPVRNQQTIRCLGSSQSSASPEIDVVDALHESRMTSEEMELLNRVEKEKELNKARLLKTTRTARMVSSLGDVTQVKREVDTKLSSLLPPGSATSRLLTRDHMRRKTTEGDGKTALRIDPAIANASSTPRTSLPTPKSALSTVTSPDEFDPRFVHFPETTTYWVGRYIALHDKVRTQEVVRVISRANPQITSDDSDDERSDAQHEPFETAERRRMRSVLEDLRSCCRGEKALKSFEKFEDSLLMTKSGTQATAKQPANETRNIAGATDVPITAIKPRHPWLFGSASNETTAASTISSVSKPILNNKLPSRVGKPSGLIKSITTGNLAALGSHMGEDKARVSSSVALASNKVQHTRHPSNLSIQAQMNARALREREERAARRVDETRRRASLRSVSGISASTQTAIRKSDKAQTQPNTKSMEFPLQRTKASPQVSQTREIHKQRQSRKSSGITTIGTGDPERQLAGGSENLTVSIANSILQVVSEDEASPFGRQGSVPRELRRKTNRQSSGDRLKNMVTGGLKGVRRMGRSLTGRSELEELGQPFSPGLSE